MDFKPLGDRVLIKRDEVETTTPSGLFIPDAAQDDPMEGKVIAVGPGKKDENGYDITMNVTEGDKVIFGKWGGTEINLDGEEYTIMKESDIIGILE